MRKAAKLLRQPTLPWLQQWSWPLFGVCALTLVSLSQPVLASSCGPGPGWVSTCQASVNTVQTTAVLDVTIQTQTGPLHLTNLLLSGPATTQIGAPSVDQNGDAFLLISISRQVSTTLPNGLQISAQSIGTGTVLEQSPGSALADSFLDVSFNLTLNQQVLQTAMLHGVADRDITQLPLNLPQGPSQMPDACGTPSNAVSVSFCLVPLNHPVNVLNANGAPVVTLNSVRLDVSAVPEPSTLYLMGSVLAGLLGYTMQRRTGGRR